MKTKILLLFILFTIIISCKKDNPASTIEEKVQTSAVAQKKFSCNINGVLFETDSTLGLYYIDTLGKLKIFEASGYDYPDSTFIGVSYIDSTLFQHIPLYDTIKLDHANFQMDRYKNGVYIDNYWGYSGYLYLTAHDTINHLVSGKFDCWLTTTTINDTVHITNGRFTNMHYDLYP